MSNNFKNYLLNYNSLTLSIITIQITQIEFSQLSCIYLQKITLHINQINIMHAQIYYLTYETC